jgi:hypothetical protein
MLEAKAHLISNAFFQLSLRFDGDSMKDPLLYQSTVGSLQYLSLTQFDLAFAVN